MFSPLVVIQRNPLSGSGRGRQQLLLLVSELRRSGFRVRMFSSRERLDEFVRRPESSSRLRCIVAAGGDGTLASVIDRHPQVLLAVMPLGTENLVARFLKIPLCGKFVADLIRLGEIRSFDSGLVGSQRFLLMLSCGPDARVIQLVNENRSRNIRRLSYLFPVIRAMFCEPLSHYEVQAKGLESVLRGCHVLVTNIPRYGFDLRFSPEADPTDGLLDIRVAHCRSRWQMIMHLLRVFFRLSIPDDQVTRIRSSGVTIRSVDAGTEPRLSQYDGDPGPAPELQVVIEEKSVKLLCPEVQGSAGRAQIRGAAD
ncbi:MAG: diacylglycerol/lipid kinase family protein [Planctomycetaceae bacterium]